MGNTAGQKVVAMIPARGGSKAVPRKNVLPVGGKPLIAWNIEAALKASTVGGVYVSTDDPEIASISKQYGAEVINRPVDISGDAASSESALLHGLESLAISGEKPDLLVFMQCTSPLTTSEDIDAAVEKLCSEKADSCFTAKPFHYFVWKQTPDGTADGVNHDKRLRLRRQDREPQFEENGAVYVMKAAGFIEAKHRFFGKIVCSLMPSDRCFEIDEPVDIKIAEMLLGEREQAKMLEKLPCRIKALLLDFDGVMTDNRVLVDQNGTEAVFCDRSDGWGLEQLKKSGVKICVLSTERNPVVSARCKKLGIECRQGLGEKKFEAYQNWCIENGVRQEETIFVGNDANDVECLKAAGCGVVPSDAYPEAKRVASVALTKSGGKGAVRELCEMVMRKRH